jgi:type II secretory pathway component PulL
LLRIRLRTIVVAIAFLGLIFAVFVQTVQLQRTKARLQAEFALEAARAQARYQQARAAVDQMSTQLAEQEADVGTLSSSMSRDSLKRTLEFYEGMQKNASTPEARARAGERVRQIRQQLDGEPEGGKL